MHAVLLKGQGLTIERPARTTGILVGAGASALALVLAIALLIKAAGWPISFPQFLAYLGAGILVFVSLAFAFWAYGCLTLRYVLDMTGLTICWGLMKHFISIDAIEKLVPGRGEQQPRPGGVGWWGYHVGRGQAQGLGRVLFFSTHRAPEDLVYVQTADATYALSPQDPGRFIAETQRFQRAGQPSRVSAVERDPLSAHPIWADRVAQWLAALAIIANLALWGYVFAIIPDLPAEIRLEFPPLAEGAYSHDPRELLVIPATATAILVVNLLAALGFQWKERAATYLLMSGAIFFQLLFWFATAVAIAKA